MSQKIIAVGIFSTLVVCCSLASGQTTVFNYKDRGQYSDFGVHDKNNSNYLAGYIGNEYRNFFVFDLTGVIQPIASATLNLSLPGVPRPGYDSPDPSGNFELHDVVTSISSLTAGTGGVAAFNDLASGVVFGDRSITNADAGTVVDIPLNASAIAAMNSNHGLFAMGGSVTTLTTPPAYPAEAVFAFTGATGFSDTSQLRLTFVPEPTGAALTANFAMIFGMWRSRKRPMLQRCT